MLAPPIEIPWLSSALEQCTRRARAFTLTPRSPGRRLTRNPDYWKPGRPYLDGIEYTIIKEIATRNLAFFAGKFDVTSPYGVTVPTLKDFASQAPQAICEVTATNVNRTMIINSSAPPFDTPPAP